MGSFSSKVSRILNGGDGLVGLWIVGQPSPTPAISHAQQGEAENVAGDLRGFVLKDDNEN